MLSIQEQVKAAAEQFDGLDPTVLALTLTLFRSTTVLDRCNAAELAPHGLTLSQFNVLTVLHRADQPLTMTTIGDAVAVRLGNLTGVVDTLVKRGLVSRRRNPQDRRSLLVTLSPEGARFLADFLPDHWSYLQTLFSELTTAERRDLLQLLDKLASSIVAAGPPPLAPATRGTQRGAVPDPQGV